MPVFNIGHIFFVIVPLWVWRMDFTRQPVPFALTKEFGNARWIQNWFIWAGPVQILSVSIE